MEANSVPSSGIEITLTPGHPALDVDRAPSGAGAMYGGPTYPPGWGWTERMGLAEKNDIIEIIYPNDPGRPPSYRRVIPDAPKAEDVFRVMEINREYRENQPRGGSLLHRLRGLFGGGGSR